MLPSQLQSLIEEYCMGMQPTDAQIDEIMDLAISLSADSSEVAQYIEKMQQGPTKEERDAIAKAEAERKAKEEAKRKAEAERKAKEEAERKAKEAAERKAEAERKAKEEAERKAKEEAKRKAEAERKAKEEAEHKAKQKTIEVKVTDISSKRSERFENATVIVVLCKCDNLGTRVYDVELVLIDILTDKRYTVSKRMTHMELYNGRFIFTIDNNTLPSKFKCQAIFRWKGNVIATSEFYELVRK